MENAQRSEKRKSKTLATLLVMYIYVPYLTNIIENMFHASPAVLYLIYTVLAIAALGTGLRVNCRVLVFLALFTLMVLLNCMLVSYRYYVLVQGVQALIYLTIPCLCVSNPSFDLNVFIEKWRKFSIWNLPLVMAAIFLLKKELVPYSIFTAICVPNVVICSYMVLQNTGKHWRLYSINAAINIFLTAILGGRMAAVISTGMLLFAYFYSAKIKIWKKVLLFSGLAIAAYALANHMLEILFWISKTMERHGIYSRTVGLLIEQMETNEIYWTRRDYIYAVCIEYIKDRMGLPGGFGVPLYLTSGEYYHAHNIILELIIFFGVWGTLILVGGMCIRAKKLKRTASLKCRRFMYFLLLGYAGIGMSGSSIWIHYLSTMFISMFFFGSDRFYQSVEVQKGRER